MRTQAVLGALLAALLFPVGAHAESGTGQLEPTILVDSAVGSPAESVTTLLAGRTYSLSVNGYYFETIPTTDGGTFTYTYDGVYCFEGSTPTAVCSRETPRVFDRTGLTARIGGSGSFSAFYRLGTSSSVPAFKQGNNYSYDFTPATTGRLQLSIPRDLRDSYRGALSVTLYGPPSPGATGPPDSGPSPDLHDLLNSACTGSSLASPLFKAHRSGLRDTSTAPLFCPQYPARASRWGRPSALPALDAGDEAIVLGPTLSATQRDVTITLSTSTGDVAVALTEDDAKYRKYARRSCLIVARLQAGRDLAADGLISGIDSSLSVDAFTEAAGIAGYLLPCLKAVDDDLASKSRSARAASAATAPRALPAASGCRALALPIKVTAASNPSSVRIRVRRSYPRPDVLRVTCTKTRSGLVVRVRPRRSGVALRRLVGKRLSVGLLRPANARSTARGSITFRR
jgi:hypothetical protein